MRRVLFIIQKEFLQIFRNRQMLPIIFLMPIIQMCVLSFATTFEIKRIDLAVVDSDISPASRRGWTRPIGLGRPWGSAASSAAV